MKSAVLIVLLSLSCFSAQAQRVATVGGIGQSGCGEYLESRQGGNGVKSDLYVTWTWGFISAYNLHSVHPDIEKLPERPTVLAYMDKFCRDEPLSLFVKGVIALIGDMGGWRPPKPLE